MKDNQVGNTGATGYATGIYVPSNNTNTHVGLNRIAGCLTSPTNIAAKGGQVAGNRASWPARLALGLVDQGGQQPEGDRQIGLGHSRPPRAGQQGAVVGHQGQVALAVPAVDGEDRGQGAAHRAAAASAQGR